LLFPVHQEDVIMVVIGELGCSKICAQWGPQMVIDTNREARKVIVTDLLCHYDTGDEGLLFHCHR
jgi:hypothetical protein